MAEIHNPRTGQWVEVHCTGCMCHELAMQFGSGGCCAECGCPKTEAGFAEYAKAHPDRVRGLEPTLGTGDRPDDPGNAPTLGNTEDDDDD